MSERLTHNQFTFTRWSEYWCSEQAAHQSDLCREMVSLEANGIPSESMKIVCFDFDRSGGFRWYRLTIDFSASSQVVALADRLHQAWLTQKAIEEAQWDKQYEAAMKNQEAQGMNNPDFEWGF